MHYPIVAAALLLPVAAAASGLQTFDVPGAATTCGTAISSDGFVTGLARKGTPSRMVPFAYKAGYFFFPHPYVPTGLVTFSGVNKAHVIVGSDIDQATFKQSSFVYSNKATSIPNLALGAVTALSGITDDGTVLGQVTAAKSSRYAYQRLGFTLDKSGTMSLIDAGSGDTLPTGMDPTASYVVGLSLGNAGAAGWVYHDGSFAPVAFPGALFTQPNSVSRMGHVFGTYTTNAPQAPVTHGFKLHDGIYTSWDIPGADSTQIKARNQYGQLTGCYTANGATHGYIYTP